MIVRPARTSPVRAFSPKKAAHPRFLRDGLHPSAGAHLGQTTTTTTNTVQQGIAKGSSLTAGGNVTVNAGGDALFEGAQVNATGNINVDAENISVIAAQNSSGSKHNTEYLQVGLSLNASTSNVSLTAGFSQSDSELNNQNTDAMGSSLSAGGNVNLNARNDLAIIGSDINGDDSVALTAGNDIIIKAAESQFSSNSEDSHLSAGAGANFGSNGVGFTANMAMGEGELDREGTTHSNSHITAGKTLTVKSGNDTTIAGGNLAATDVDMDIGGNLTVASVQNTSQVEGNRWDVSANITVGGGASGGASVGYGETEGSSAWVNEQSSIIGSGSVNIRTEGHTQIDGAVIANIDENGNDLGNLTLDTGSLAYTDIADHDKEKSYYLNVGFTMGDDTNTNQTESGNNYNASGNYSNHDKEQINRATVGEGSIIVRDNPQQDLSDLNRDTSIAQEITKDDSKDVNLYASTTALDSLGNLVESSEKRDEQLNKWKDNVASVGSPGAYMGLLNASLDALEQTPGAINDAIEAVGYLIDNIGKLSPEEAAALNDKLSETHAMAQEMANSDNAAEQELGEKLLAGITELQEGLLAQQGQLPEDNHQIADAPPMPEKSAETQQQEFEAAQNLLNNQFAAGQQSSTDAFENGNIAGWVDSWGSGGNGLIGLNADYESYMGHRQNEIDTFNQFKSELSGLEAFGFYGGANLFEGMINFGESLAGMTRYTGIQGSGTAADAWSDLGTGLQNAGSYAYHDPSGFAYAVAVDPFVNVYDRYTTIYNNDGLGAALGTAATDGLLNMLERPSLGINIPAVKGKGGNSNAGDSSPSGTGGERSSSGAESAATYPNLKDSLAQQNLNNIAATDPRLAVAVHGDGSGSKNFSMGQGTNSEADRLGKIWVGDGAKPTSDGSGLVSADGTRVYRYPVEKDSPYATTGIQANFETLKADPATGRMVRAK